MTNAMTWDLAQTYLNDIRDDESLLNRATKYLKKLVREKTADPTLIPKDEYFASLDESLAQYERGEYYTFTPNETFEEFTKRFL